MAASILIRGGRLIDPSQEIDETADLAIVDGRVAAIGKKAGRSADLIIEAGGKIVAPGLIDMHVHLREPGREEDETILTGTTAAVAGGFTSIACIPNTEPPTLVITSDNPKHGRYERTMEEVNIIGRVKSFTRRL